VLGIERLAREFVGDPRLAITDVLEREVRRVAAVAEREQVFRRSCRTPSSSVSSETPVQCVSSTTW